MLTRRKYMRVWVASLARHERALMQEVVKKRNSMIKLAARAYEKSGAVPTYIYSQYQDNLVRLFQKHYRATAFTFSTLAMGQIVSVKAQRKSTRRIFENILDEWIRWNALKKARMIKETDVARVVEAIRLGAEEGEGIEAIGRSIRKETGLTAWRAATIARTEVHEAAVHAAMETARDSQQEFGIRFTKEWGAVHDNRTRSEHAAADGQKIEMDEKFNVGGELMDAPGDPVASAENLINCRCAVYHEEILPNDF